MIAVALDVYSGGADVLYGVSLDLQYLKVVIWGIVGLVRLKGCHVGYRWTCNT